MKTRILTRSPFALFAFFALVALALGCLCPQQAVAEDEGAAPLQAGSGALGAAPSLTAQAEGDLQFVGLEGASVAGSASEGYAIYVRDGDTGYVTLKVKNNSGRDLEFVTMVDGPSYAEGASGLTPVAYGSDDDAFYPITFPPYRSEDTLATGAEHMASQWLTSETTGVGYPGYWIEAGATPTFKLQIDAGKLAAGTYNWNIQLGRVRWDYEEHLYAPEPGLSWKQWDYVGEEMEETYSAQIPIKVVVYSQPNASIKAQEQTNGGFFPTFSDLGSDGFDFGAIDLGSATGEQLKASRTLSVYNDRVAHSSDKVANATDIHGNTTDVRVVFDGENTSGGLDTLDGAFSWGNGTLYDTNWAPLPPTSGTQRADYTASFDATDLIAGTYTGNLIVNTTPHTVKFNGATGNSAGVYKIPLKLTLTGTNSRLLPRATNLTATPGNGRVDLRWTPGTGAGKYTEYTIWRREGTENQDDPDKLDWSLYEEIGVKVVGELSDDDMLYVDATAQNGTTYSYTVIYGRPYHGYAAEVASATPGATYQSPMLAPCADVNDGVGSIEVSWEMHENYGGKNNDGTGMVDHFNIYRDGVLVDQIDRSAVRDEVEYGWREEVPGSGNYTYGVTKHSYSWAVEETVPELYTVYSWAVSAVSPNGVESDLSDSIPAQALGETPSILTHSAWFDSTFYDEATDMDKPAILIYADEYGSGDTLKKVRVWRKEGTGAPSTAGAPYAIADKYNGYSSYMYDFADTNVEKNKTYTYTIQGVDNDDNATDFYTFTVKAVEDVQFGNVKPSNGVAAFSVVNNGTTARLQWNSDYYYDANDELVYAGTYKVYRNDMLIATLSGSGSDGYMDYQDNPGSDGVYTYRVDKVVNASGTNITVRGRDHVFHRNTQPVDPATLLQVPGAPTLTGRTASETNVILSWTPSSEGGAPEGYHIYRTDGNEVKTGGRYVTYTYWNGPRDVYESWGNGRYITLAGNDTLSFVDGRTNDRPNNDHYQNDPHQGTIDDLGWNDDCLPHIYYITAYNRAGESEPSQLVVFDTHDEDQWGNPIAPPNDADEAPAAPTVNNVWIDWDEYSSQRYGFDSSVGGQVRVSWSDVAIGPDIDKWTLTYSGLGGYNPTNTEMLGVALAMNDPATKLGTSQDAPSCYVTADTGNNGQLGNTISVTVTAQNTAGATASQPATLNVLSFPRSYVLPDNGGAVVRWTDLFNDTTTQVTGWEIWRKAEYGIWERAEVRSAPGDYDGTGKTDNNQPVGYYEFRDTNVENGWTYQYKVVAKCSDGIDRPGQVREVTPARTATVEAPGAPQNLQARVVNGEVVLTWDPPATGGAVTEFCPQVKSVDAGGTDIAWYYGTIGNVSGDSTSTTWVPSKPGTYKILVWAYSEIDGNEAPDSLLPYEIEGGQSAYDAMTDEQQADALYSNHSNIVTVTITQAQLDQQASERPVAPAPVAAAGDGQVTITWPACDGATYYTVEKPGYNSYVGIIYPNVPEVTIAAVPGQQAYTYVHEDAQPGVKYYYNVYAYNASGSAFAQVSAKPTGKTRDQVAAERVEALIEALPTVSDIESAEYPSNTYDSYENEVAEVRAVYDALTDKQKSLVDAAAVKKLDDVATALVARKYAAVVRPVQDSVNALPSADDIAAASEEELGDIASQIADARAAYNALPAEAKPGVDVSKLTDAEAALATARQVFADKAAAKAVDELIGALPALDALSIGDEAAVSEAREAYVALTATQRAYVTKLAVLEAAEARMGVLRKVEEVKQAIDALSPADELQLDDLGAVAAARDAYEALPESDQPLVGPDRVSKLDACWSKIQELIAASPEYAAARVDELIDAIGEVTPDSADAITEARSAYDALTPEAQSKVEKLAVLEAAEQALEDFEAAAEIDRMISSLPSPLSLDDAEQVAAVREAYDKASESVRAKVTKLSDLEAAEGHIAELKEAARIDLSEPFGSMTLSATSFTYNGADCRPGVVVEVGGKTLLADRDYEMYYANNRNAGTAMVTIFGIGDYKGQITRSFTIKKAANPLSVKAKAVKAKYKKVKKKTQKVAALTVGGAQGKLSYKIVKIKTKKKLTKQAKKKIKLAAGGKLALKKKMKKGTYKVTVRVSAAGNGNYLPASRDVTVKVRVK